MTKQRLEAQPAYESAHMVATDLLGHIRDLLQDLPAPDGEVVIDWAHVGSLAEVNRRLASVVAFLEGRDGQAVFSAHVAPRRGLVSRLDVRPTGPPSAKLGPHGPGRPKGR